MQKAPQRFSNISDDTDQNDYLLPETSSSRANTSIACSNIEVTFSPICIAWTEKLHGQIHHHYSGNIWLFYNLLWNRTQLTWNSPKVHILWWKCRQKYQKVLLVIYVADNRKMVTLYFVYINFVEWNENFPNLRNSCMFKDMIDFREPPLKFFTVKLEF